MDRARRMGWWIAVPAGVALGLLLALGLDRAASPASAQDGAAFSLSVEQIKINQRIARAGVRRANRASERLDELVSGGQGGGAGPAGPAGPGAERISFSSAVGGPSRRILDLAGVSLTVACEAGSSGETNLTITAGIEQETTVAGTSSTDGGTDPNSPNPPQVTNFQTELPVGPASALGGPSAPDGEFSRSVASVLFITRTQTLSVDAFTFADGASNQCSFNGVVVPA